jgi:hypothetical protein
MSATTPTYVCLQAALAQIFGGEKQVQLGANPSVIEAAVCFASPE